MADKERERQQFELKKLALEREIRELELQTAREIREIQKWGRSDSGNRLPRGLQEAAIGSPSFTNSPYDFKSLVYGLNGQTAIALNVDEEGNLRTIGDGGEGVDLPRALFEDIRVAPFTPDIGWTFPYSINSFIVFADTTGSGSITQESGAAILSSGSAANSNASIQTRRNLRFSAGLSCRALFQTTFSTGIAGSRQAIGVGDDMEGLYFGFNGTQFGIFVRSNGADEWVAQSDWNLDPLDGTGESGFSLNPTMGNIYGIRRQGGEFGPVEFYVSHPVDATLIPVHRIGNGNQTDTPLIVASNLPLRAEVANETNVLARVVRTFWAIAGVEGIMNPVNISRHSFSFSRLVPRTETNIFTIRNNETFGTTRNRTHVRLMLISGAVNEGMGTVEFFFRSNATLDGDTTFIPIHPNDSAVSYNTTAVYVPGTGVNAFPLQLARVDSTVIDLTPYDLAIPVGESITITSATSGDDAICSVGLSWAEYN